MPVRVYCACCGEILKDIPFRQLADLSGQELCKSCQEKFEAVRTKLDKTHGVVIRKLEALYKAAQQDLNSVIQEAKRSVL